MAVEYLNTVQDKPSLSLIGRRLFEFPAEELDFFLPQLLYLYVTKIDAASVTHAYIEKRHKNDAHFTILCIWFLSCYTETYPNKHENHAVMLRSLLTNQKSKTQQKAEENSITLSLDQLETTNWMDSSSMKRKEHGILLSQVDLERNREPIYVDRLLSSQQTFINRLVHIGVKMAEVHLLSSKQEKTNALQLELQMLNTMLPNFVWIPFDFQNTIMNICVEESAVLNSKEKVPYLFFAEVIRVPPTTEYIDGNMGETVEIVSNSNERQNNRILLKTRVYHDTTDPSVAVFAEAWSDKKDRIRSASKNGNISEWDLIPVIVKTGDDLTQEAFAQQLLFTFKDLWNEEGIPLYLYPYKIICVGPDAGLIEPILDTLSLHQIKRHLTNVFRANNNPITPTLKHHFENVFGVASSETYVNAQKNFIQSAAAYSLVSYYLQLKDRHNGNILLDMEGHLIHIDYGFLLSSSPRNLGFETAPFKLTSEIVDVIGGIDSDMFLYFKSLLLRGLMAARKHHRRIVSLVEIMAARSKMQCFRAGSETVRALEARFHVSSTDEQLQQLVDTLVDGSRDSYTTRFYDSFQYYTNGIH
ncbi:unnamed protein product [Caenorhabditis sp. 36 PRJEB53466]|nr:unnamed protein product [Caenorhabditis sp. 36 PRJEB53466]